MSTAESPAVDEAALARVITAALKDKRWRDSTPLDFARAIIDSDWLERVRADAWDEGWIGLRDGQRATVRGERAPHNPYRDFA